MKYIITESQYFFLRRGINLKDYFYKSLEKLAPCRYRTIMPYFEQITTMMVVSIATDNEDFRNAYSNENDSLGEELETMVRHYVLSNHIQTMIQYYKLKCKRELRD